MWHDIITHMGSSQPTGNPSGQLRRACVWLNNRFMHALFQTSCIPLLCWLGSIIWLAQNGACAAQVEPRTHPSEPSWVCSPAGIEGHWVGERATWVGKLAPTSGYAPMAHNTLCYRNGTPLNLCNGRMVNGKRKLRRW